MKSFLAVVCFFSLMPICTVSGADKPEKDCSIIRFVEVGEGDEPGAKMYKVRGKDEKLPVTGPDIVNACAIQRADVKFDEMYGYWNIQIKLTDEGSKAFRAATERLMGKRIAIIFRDEILIAPIVNGVIPNGEVLISGGISEKEAREIAAALSGK